MARKGSASKRVPTGSRRSRMRFTEQQLKILISAFNQKPYPGYATRRKLASEINTEESRVQIWFQNRRSRHMFQKRSKRKTSESRQDHERDPLQGQNRGARRGRTSYGPSQLHILVEAFSDNPYPGVQAREQLAREIGVPESRVQVWFQNRRSRFGIRKDREYDESSEEDEPQGVSQGRARAPAAPANHSRI